MAWVKVYEAVIGPKLRTLANDIGCSQNEALGVLVRLWVWGIRNVNAAGEIIGGSEADIEAVIQTGLDNRYSSKTVIRAMKDSGRLGVFQVVGERCSVGQKRLRVLDELLVGLVLLNAHSVSYGGLKQLILSPAIVDTRTIFLVRFPFADLPWVGIPEFFKPFRVGCLGNDFCWNSRFIKRDRGRSFLSGAFFALSFSIPSLPLNILVPLRLPFSPVVKTDTTIFNIEPAGILHRTNDSFG